MIAPPPLPPLPPSLPALASFPSNVLLPRVRLGLSKLACSLLPSNVCSLFQHQQLPSPPHLLSFLLSTPPPSPSLTAQYRTTFSFLFCSSSPLLCFAPFLSFFLFAALFSLLHLLHSAHTPFSSSSSPSPSSSSPPPLPSFPHCNTRAFLLRPLFSLFKILYFFSFFSSSPSPTLPHEVYA